MANVKEGQTQMHYYEYNVYCNDYLWGGVVREGEEMYARDYSSLVNKVRKTFHRTYGISLKEAEPVRVVVVSTDDEFEPNNKKEGK